MRSESDEIVVTIVGADGDNFSGPKTARRSHRQHAKRGPKDIKRRYNLLFFSFGSDLIRICIWLDSIRFGFGSWFDLIWFVFGFAIGVWLYLDLVWHVNWIRNWFELDLGFIWIVVGLGFGSEMDLELDSIWIWCGFGFRCRLQPIHQQIFLLRSSNVTRKSPKHDY